MVVGEGAVDGLALEGVNVGTANIASGYAFNRKLLKAIAVAKVISQYRVYSVAAGEFHSCTADVVDIVEASGNG